MDSSETDSGCHMQEVDEMLTDLPTRIGEMEAELRVGERDGGLVRSQEEVRGKDIGVESPAPSH